MQVITKARRACSNAGAAVHRVIVENDAKLNPVRRWVLGTYAARPSVLLALLTICNLLNYADRGLTAVRAQSGIACVVFVLTLRLSSWGVSVL